MATTERHLVSMSHVQSDGQVPDAHISPSPRSFRADSAASEVIRHGTGTDGVQPGTPALPRPPQASLPRYWPKPLPSLPMSLPGPAVHASDGQAQYHWHQDTHYHQTVARDPAQKDSQLQVAGSTARALTSPLTLRSGCLVVGLVLLGALLTMLVMLMGLALVAQILAVR